MTGDGIPTNSKVYFEILKGGREIESVKKLYIIIIMSQLRQL